MAGFKNEGKQWWDPRDWGRTEEEIAAGEEKRVQANELMKKSRMEAKDLAEGDTYERTYETHKAKYEDGTTLFYPQELFTDSQPNGIQFFINAREQTAQKFGDELGPLKAQQDLAENETEQNRSSDENYNNSVAKSGAMLSALLMGYAAKKGIANGGRSGASQFLGGSAAAAVSGFGIDYVVENTEDFFIKQTQGTKRLLKSIQLHIPQSVVAGYTANWNESELGMAGLLGTGRAGDDWFGEGGVLASLWNAEGGEFATRNIIAGAASIPKAAGANADIGALIEATSKKVNNPYKEQLFKSMGFRKFAFSYVFSPRNPSEARQVQEIIKTFKMHMHPDVDVKGLFLLYPAEFSIEFMHKKPTGEVVQNTNLPKVSSCALTGVKTTYGPDGSFNTFQNSGGMPTEISMELTFTELETLTRQRIMDGL